MEDTAQNNNMELARLPLVDFKKAYNFMLSLEYTDSEGIQYLEQQLYNLIRDNAENAEGLVLLLHEQIMNNRGQRARSIAYKVWDLGVDLSPELKILYISDLINLGFVEMAGTALSNIIENLEQSVGTYSQLLIKYAIASGNLVLLSRILAYLPESSENNILRNWISLSEYMKTNTVILSIMKRIFEKIQDTMLGFDYNLFFDRNYPEVEFVFYVGPEVDKKEELIRMLNLQISSCCASRKIQDLTNLGNTILPISRRRSLAASSHLA